MENLVREYDLTIDELEIKKTVGDTIGAFAIFRGCDLERALEMIIEEWTENRLQKSPPSPNNISPTDQLESRLNTINKLADEVIVKLKRASL